jgi:hypothetical protein
VTFLREGGAAPVVKTYTVPATSRFNIAVRSMVPEVSNENFGALIESLNSVNIAVERSLYWTVIDEADYFQDNTSTELTIDRQPDIMACRITVISVSSGEIAKFRARFDPVYVAEAR